MTYPAKLTDKQYKWAIAYYRDGQSATEAVHTAGYAANQDSAYVLAHKLIKNNHIREWYQQVDKDKSMMPTTREGQLRTLQSDFDWKVGKLKRVIDVSIPDDNVTKEELIHNKLLCRYNLGAGLNAIAELNRMQGHIAPTKSVNLDIKADADMRKLIELSNKLLAEMQQDDKQLTHDDNKL